MPVCHNHKPHCSLRWGNLCLLQRVWTWDEENSFLAAKLLAEEGVTRFLPTMLQTNGWGVFIRHYCH